ncbi:MAG: class I SAM-dependent methyltransferase [Dissulfurispiraceae bacterium]
MHCIEKFFPAWRGLSVHESSPVFRGASVKLRKEGKHYLPTYFFPGYPLGEMHTSGFMNQDVEQQTFPGDFFDLVITQDVLEHVFDPSKAFREIARTLRRGGAHVFTAPLINENKPSEVAARRDSKGSIEFLCDPQYHGNPIDGKGSLVTIHWGYDITDFILKESGLYTTIVFIDNINLGIRAEYIEVLISRKI